jgi:hypothetical protein
MGVYKDIFTDQVLSDLFPPDRADQFFDAMFGDASEGSFDIRLGYGGYSESDGSLIFNLELHERPGHCLACNLTYGLPQVFSRHPIINVQGLVKDIEEKLGGETQCVDWELGSTRQQERSLHVVPLKIMIE